MTKTRIYDMHVHLYEFGDSEIEEMLTKNPDLVLVAVSDDLDSLERTLRLYEAYPDRIVPCAGFHPWSIGEAPLSQVDEILRIAYRSDVACIGEVGLDKKFVPHTWETQLEVFKRFLEYAAEVDSFVNVHSPDAWQDALSLLLSSGVGKAMFHWYTGPQDLIPVIGEAGYKVSLNPALKIQKKHLAIARTVPLEYIVLESDGPYNYRGLRLTPLLIKEAVDVIAKERRVNALDVLEAAKVNSERLILTVKS